MRRIRIIQRITGVLVLADVHTADPAGKLGQKLGLGRLQWNCTIIVEPLYCLFFKDKRKRLC